MKNIFKLLLLLLVSVSLSACNALDELTEEEEDMTLKIPVHINSTNGVWTNYSNSAEIDINQWMGEWFDKLESIKVIKVSYLITDFQINSDENGQVKAKLDINNILTLDDEYIVYQAYKNHVVYELKDIEKAINKNGKLSAKYSGSALCGESGLHFTVKVTVTIKAKYKI